jgi:UDP-N-acetylmuramoyl-tripeptide--D-alanyl-D-alanine ligase
MFFKSAFCVQKWYYAGICSMKHVLRNIVVFLLTLEAKMVLARHKPQVIVVSGSVGKTTTKDMIYTALSGSEHVRKSEKSFNSEIGVPLTILGLPNAKMSVSGWAENIAHGVFVFFQKKYPDVLVLEVGADHPGDLKRLQWLAPQVVVYTRFPDVPAHVEFFASPEAVIEEKREMRRALREQGVLCINSDDSKMQDEPILETQKKIHYGYKEGADVHLSQYTHQYKDGVLLGGCVHVEHKGAGADVLLSGVLGQHYTYSVGSAVAVACGVFGIPLGTVAKRIAEQEAGVYAPGRMRVFQGVRDSVVIDDSYNSSPVAVAGLLDALREVRVHGKKIVVLGDMLELGEHTAREHRKAGESVADVADVFVGVGVRMKEAVQAVQQKGTAKALWFADAEKAGDFLREELQSGDVVAIKGSRHAMRMERTVKKVLRDAGDEQWLVQ